MYIAVQAVSLLIQTFFYKSKECNGQQSLLNWLQSTLQDPSMMSHRQGSIKHLKGHAIESEDLELAPTCRDKPRFFQKRETIFVACAVNYAVYLPPLPILKNSLALLSQLSNPSHPKQVVPRLIVHFCWPGPCTMEHSFCFVRNDPRNLIACINQCDRHPLNCTTRSRCVQ